MVKKILTINLKGIYLELRLGSVLRVWRKMLNRREIEKQQSLYKDNI